MWFDAFGRYAFGQISSPSSSYTLVADAGSYTITGNATVAKSSLAAAAGSYAITVNATIGKSSLLAASGSYAISGQSIALRSSLLAAKGTYTITGQPVGGASRFSAQGGSYAITGQPAVLNPRLVAQTGVYTITGSPSHLPGVWRLQGGAYVITPGYSELRRTGDDWAWDYTGGVGHYLMEMVEARRAAAITRRIPPPVVRASRPDFKQVPMAPPLAPTFDIDAFMAEHAAQSKARRVQIAAVERQRRNNEAAILLLA